MVCCMYYTDVFVGTVNDIEKLRKALEAVLEESGLKTDDLDQLNALASGLGFLAGLPACLCKTKKSVEEGLGKIYEELKIFKYCSNFNISKLNCDSCSKDVPCKCCVIQSIKAVKKCDCINGKDSCHCKDKDVSCAKVLAGLEACLHLQCLQSDMEDICKCSGSECCKGGQCDGKSGGSGVSCDFCKTLQSSTPVPTTGLGLSPPNPIRLAQRLDKFFGTGPGPKSGCACKCGSNPGISCCCLACDRDQYFDSCTAKCGSQGCSSQHTPKECPCKAFCSKINSIKVPCGSSLMRCCERGQKCHCGLDPSSQCSGKCCETGKKSVKCLIRRLVTYFKSLQPNPSKPDFSQNCCELLCVAKTCEFLKMFFDKGGKDVCGTCKSGKSQCPSKGQCCAGPTPKCNSGSCQNCDECQQICAAKEFSRALEALKLSSPCGHELYRTL
ncbi:hypothetical protein X943_001253, partial [Babesia divergens]